MTLYDRLTSSGGSGWLPFRASELVNALEQLLRMLTERSQMRRLLPLMLAALFCTITVLQLARPLSAITLSSTPRVATRHQRFTRNTPEEVSNKPIDIATASCHFTFMLPVVEREGDLAATSMPDEVDLTESPSKYLFRRRTPRRSPDDSD